MPLPANIGDRLRALLSELQAEEQRSREAAPQPVPGEIELRINENQALWYVSYRTDAS
jgi:hypothetical protein